MFYLTTHSTHFIYGYMASDIWLRTILIVRKETRCRHIGYSYRLTARVLLYAPSHRQDNTYHGLCYTSRGALAGTRNSSMGPPHEGSIWRPIAPWVNALPLSYVPLLGSSMRSLNGNGVISTSVSTGHISFTAVLPCTMWRSPHSLQSCPVRCDEAVIYCSLALYDVTKPSFTAVLLCTMWRSRHSLQSCPVRCDEAVSYCSLAL